MIGIGVVAWIYLSRSALKPAPPPMKSFPSPVSQDGNKTQPFLPMET